MITHLSLSLPGLPCPVCRLNAFNYNKLLPRTTTGAALMQNGSLMARFAAPTCWNLLHMVHMDGKLDEKGTTTVFTQVGKGVGVVVGCRLAGWRGRQRVERLIACS